MIKRFLSFCVKQDDMSRRTTTSSHLLSQKSLDFLKALAAHNSKVWFENHRGEYEEYLLMPLRRLVEQLSPLMLTIDDRLETAPAVNKTISRIYRDTRFSKNKSLFKTNMWIVFKRPGSDWRDAPAFFLEIAPNWYRYGMGFYSASPTTMTSFRKAIDDEPEEFQTASAFYRRRKLFEVAGEKYKRIIDPHKPREIQTWYQRRNLYLICNRQIGSSLFSRRLVDDLAEGFGVLAPLYHCLWKVKVDSQPAPSGI
jgi:uncharacterized protein (TIGR02453 family)